MFATGVTKEVVIGDVTVTIKKLNWKKLRDAAQARTEVARAEMKALPSAMLERIVARQAGTGPDGAPPAPVPIEQQRLARYASYDREIVLRAGVKSWTVDAKLPEAVDTLDEETAEQLHRAIVDLSLPLLEPGAEEAERKKD